LRQGLIALRFKSVRELIEAAQALEACHNPIFDHFIFIIIIILFTEKDKKK
jgi:hypothetical protein